MTPPRHPLGMYCARLQRTTLNTTEISRLVMPKCYAFALSPSLYEGSDPNGIRTRVTAVKGRCPGPLDDTVVKSAGNIESLFFHARQIDGLFLLEGMLQWQEF